MEHSTYQFQRIGSRVFSQELDDIPILHPRRNHSTSPITNHDPDQLQYFRVRQTLSGYDLSVEVLQVIRLHCGEGNGSKCLTSFVFSTLDDPAWRINLIVTDPPPLPYAPRQIREKPPEETGESPNFSILDSGMIWELGRISHNICCPLVRYADLWIKCVSYVPLQASRPPLMVTLRERWG